MNARNKCSHSFLFVPIVIPAIVTRCCGEESSAETTTVEKTHLYMDF